MIPAFRVTGPVKVFPPFKASVPAPFLTIPNPIPEMTPPNVSVLAVVVIVRVAPNDTAVVPKFSVLVPMYVKLPCNVMPV